MEKIRINNMKIFLLLIPSILFLVTVTSCTNDEENIIKENSEKKVIGEIRDVDLFASEEKLLNMVGASRYFLFNYFVDYEANTEEKMKFDVWVDYYKDGEFQKKLFAGSTFINGKDEGKLLFSLHHTINSDEKWVLSVSDSKGSTSTVSQIISQPKEGYVVTWGNLTNSPIHLEEPIILAVITGAKGGISSVRDTVFEKDQEAIEELLENDYVYFLKFQFISETR